MNISCYMFKDDCEVQVRGDRALSSYSATDIYGNYR